MPARLRAVPEFTPPEDRELQAEFEEWLAKQSLAQLRCHTRGRHEFPAMDDAKAELRVNQRQGVVEQECDCQSCGTHVRMLWGLRDEFLTGLAGGQPQYNYSENYRFGHLMTPEQRYRVKAEYRRRALAEKGIQTTRTRKA